ncbi:MAG: CD1871A family CXXC motif-containing protein [Oscillospiraceae bacterium]|nr:CD1871A family CXXC motif-containing protein [Oscillospiraceae bacterium]
MRRLLASRWTGVAAAVLGLVMMGYGAYRGEVSTVFTKAINICLECIGIG